MTEEIAKVVYYTYHLDGQSEQTAEVRIFTKVRKVRKVRESKGTWLIPLLISIRDIEDLLMDENGRTVRGPTIWRNKP